MEAQKQQLVDRLKQANNILVTVKSNPTVDHLAACIALTLALNKLGKHATAVFSGAIPSTIEFLQPEQTLEKNTDSLRDFIIALDKSKADKLRYKVEDKIVKIFITPYRTSISEKDLNFSQGDFNVDVVVALGVHAQTDLDQAITAHGRILHDATIASVNIAEGQALGGINWTKPVASSLSEMVAELLDLLDKQLLDSQIATAVLTGIVAETDRFSNNKTSPQTMSISAELMAAGANQQLVATKLAEPVPAPMPMHEDSDVAEVPAAKREDGMLEIEHEGAKPAPQSEPAQIQIDEDGSLQSLAKDDDQAEPEPPKDKEPAPTTAGVELPQPQHTEGPHIMLEPPALGGQLSAEAMPKTEFFDPMMEESASGAPPGGKPLLLNRLPLKDQAEEKPPAEPDVPDKDAEVEPPKPAVEVPEVSLPAVLPEPPAAPVTAPTPAAPNALPPSEDVNDETLSDIEKQLASPHAAAPPSTDPTSPAPAPPAPIKEPTLPSAPDAPAADLDSARQAVEQAMQASGASQPLPPIAALNAQPVDLNLHDDAMPPGTVTPPSADAAASGVSANSAPFAPPGLSLPGLDLGASGGVAPDSSPATDDLKDHSDEKQDPNAPPPVPPPMLPPPPSA